MLGFMADGDATALGQLDLDLPAIAGAGVVTLDAVGAGVATLEAVGAGVTTLDAVGEGVASSSGGHAAEQKAE